MNQYVALARVSSREQEREGFSLDVQEEALTRYAVQHGGASPDDDRPTKAGGRAGRGIFSSSSLPG